MHALPKLVFTSLTFPLRPNSSIEDKINLNYLLHLININILNVSSLSWHLSDLKTLPAVLDSRSTGADDAGILK